MKKILNITDFYTNEENEKMMKYYCDNYNFNGFELIKFDLEKDNSPLKKLIRGYHMRFFPMWLDLYLGKYRMLKEKFKENQEIFYWCGGTTREELIDYYKKELETAEKLEAEYVVFHACYVDGEGSLIYEFQYSDEEVLQNVAKLVNEVFGEKKYKFKLLLENLWWPGLRLTSKEEIEFLLKNIKYENIGFMLDTGHMLNNNPKLRTVDEGIEYIEKNIAEIGELKKYIKGVHLNFSLSGKYLTEAIEKHKSSEAEREKTSKNIYSHVSQIDQHLPFEDERIIGILESLPLDWVVYEFIYYDVEDLEKKVKCQDKILKKLNFK